MASTVEIIKVLLKDKLALEVLRMINTKDYILEDLFKEISLHSKEKITQAVTYLDKVALIENVFTRSKSFYRISARGKRILEIAEEAVIEEANTNG